MINLLLLSSKKQTIEQINRTNHKTLMNNTLPPTFSIWSYVASGKANLLEELRDKSASTKSERLSADLGEGSSTTD